MKLIPVNHNPFPKVAKSSVSYSHGMSSSHCGICEFYENRACSKVGGAIDPAYWCRLFKKQHRAVGGVIRRDDGGLIPQRTAPFPDAPEGYEYYQAPPADGSLNGVAQPATPDRGPIAGFLDKLATPSKYQMEPDLMQTQTGSSEGPKGLAPENVGMNDAGQYVDMTTGEPMPEEPVTRRPGVLPITADPSGKPEFAMPKMLDIASNIMGGNVPGGAGTVLGSGFARAAKAIEPVPNEMGFYSAVEHAVNSAPQTKASPQQWLGTLKNTPGVKSDELEWTGLEDWLKDQKGPVTKDQVADYVRGNQVQLQEVTKGDVGPQWQLSYKDGSGTFQRYQTEQEALDAVKSIGAEDRLEVSKFSDNTPTKFSQYTLPGGENYREMLLTMPNADAAKVARMTEIEQQLQSRPPGQEAQRDALRSEYKRLADETRSSGTYQSGHWDEPNVLSHIRFNDRTIDGKKTLFIEEIQSDWHQKGKRQGYKVDDAGRENLERKLQEIQEERAKLVGSSDPADRARYKELQELEGQWTDTYNRRVHDGVPDAPFKTTWPELALKRMIRYAAENGYEKVAWTPGDVQAARYDLSHQIDSLAYRKDGEGTYEISAIKDGNSVLTKNYQTPEELEGVIGKDITKKIVDGEGKSPDDFRGKNGGVKELSGLDLKVGGEGMKGFYDKILPAAANKLVKKFGAKVGREAMATDDMSKYDITPNYNGGWSLISKETGNRVPDSPSFKSGADAEKWLKERGHADKPVHSLDITPQMRKAVTEQGFPQFSKGGTVKPRLVSVAHNPFEVHSAIRRAIHGN